MFDQTLFACLVAPCCARQARCWTKMFDRLAGLYWPPENCRSAMQPTNGNGKPPHTQQPDQCLIRMGQKPWCTLGQVEPEANWKNYGSVVSEGEQPSSMAADWHASANEGDKCCHTRKKWRQSVGDKIYAVLQYWWSSFYDVLVARKSLGMLFLSCSLM